MAPQIRPAIVVVGDFGAVIMVAGDSGAVIVAVAEVEGEAVVVSLHTRSCYSLYSTSIHRRL